VNKPDGYQSCSGPLKIKAFKDGWNDPNATWQNITWVEGPNGWINPYAIQIPDDEPGKYFVQIIDENCNAIAQSNTVHICDMEKVKFTVVSLDPPNASVGGALPLEGIAGTNYACKDQKIRIQASIEGTGSCDGCTYSYLWSAGPMETLPGDPTLSYIDVTPFWSFPGSAGPATGVVKHFSVRITCGPTQITGMVSVHYCPD
jgi:hypothetical protein